jgi:hypothetical protein
VVSILNSITNASVTQRDLGISGKMFRDWLNTKTHKYTMVSLIQYSPGNSALLKVVAPKYTLLAINRPERVNREYFTSPYVKYSTVVEGA